MKIFASKSVRPVIKGVVRLSLFLVESIFEFVSVIGQSGSDLYTEAMREHETEKGNAERCEKR